MAWSKDERALAVDALRKFIKPGDRIYVNVEEAHHSGTSRHLSLFFVDADGLIRDITRLVAVALDRPIKRGKQRDSMRSDGGGMDMTFEAVYALALTLFPDHRDPRTLLREHL